MVAALLNRPLAAAVLAPDTLLVAEGDANRIDAVHLPDGKVTPWAIAGLNPSGSATCPANPRCRRDSSVQYAITCPSRRISVAPQYTWFFASYWIAS